MRITRGIFQTLATTILVAIAYVWVFIEAEKIILIVILVSLFILLSLEYLREGISQKKSRPSHNIKEDKVDR